MSELSGSMSITQRLLLAVLAVLWLLLLKEVLLDEFSAYITALQCKEADSGWRVAVLLSTAFVFAALCISGCLGIVYFKYTKARCVSVALVITLCCGLLASGAGVWGIMLLPC
ncbi:hypothetical protein [Pseudoalteromonas rubra]|uniref:Uncharacterized protein n=1 Tax=Pseudoalteromonas rubra TaxID=43658 RepID=A0A0F4QD28_9GAMM|nr:hypothetical protein [Pseudoalteromonas rubra]KJZ05588.1 hypothetical protein TW77_21935 [Pseudoalteromonas rubra]